MQYQYPFIAIVFIILIILARRATRVKSVTYGTISHITSVRNRFAPDGVAQATRQAPGQGQDADSANPAISAPANSQAQSVSSSDDRQESAMAPATPPADTYTEGQAQ